MADIKETDLRNKEKLDLEQAQKCQYEYVMAVKSTLDRKLFANDFDNWTVSQQYDWINQNLQQLYPNVPETLLNLIPAFFRQDDCCRSQVDKPAWLDVEKYRKGQRFVHDNYISIVTTTIFSLLHTYSFSDELKPIILGARSHTPYLAFKRYMSTQMRIKSWYDGEPWVKGTHAYQDMQYTRRIHKMIRTKASQFSKEEYDATCTFANPWCPDRELLLKDFIAAYPFEKHGQLPFKLFANSPYRPKPLSHADIAMVQYAFMGMTIFQPLEVGAHGATDEELEAYCHMWKYYGYLLGIDDEYNLCRGSLEEVRQRIRDVNKYWVIPNLKYATPEWEHITRCLIEPLNFYSFMYLPYRVAIILDMDILGVNMSHLYASLSYSEWATYHGWKFLLHYILKSSHIRALFSKALSRDPTENLSPEKEREFHEKSRKLVEDFSVTSTKRQ